VPLTLRRFHLRVNGCAGPAVPIPCVEQEKHRPQREQLVDSKGLSSCGPLGWGHFERVKW